MVNLIYFDGSGHKMARPVTNREEYVALRNAPDNAKNFYDARSGNEAAKASQIQFCYNDLLPDGVLKGCCHPSSTFAHDIDCGNQEEQARIKDELLAKKDEIGLLELSGSARWGIHAVCRRQTGKTIRECQYALSMATKTEYDTNSRGLARVMFTGPATPDNLFYLDDAIFEEPLTVAESAEEQKRLQEREKRNEEEVPKGAKKANKHYRPWEEGEMRDGRGKMDDGRCKMDDGRGEKQDVSPKVANERTMYIFRECMKEEDVTDADFLNEGGRHNSVKMVLCHCNQLLTEAETLGALQELMPDHWNDQNIRDLVKAYYSDYYNPQQRLSVFQKQVFKNSKRIGDAKAQENYTAATSFARSFLQVGEPTLLCNSAEGKALSELSRLFNSNTPPELPETLPKLVKAVTQSTPQKYKATVAQAMFPPLGAYPKNLSFVYVDNQVRELRINCLIVAETGSGKDSCTKQPLTHIIADMKARDKVNRERLKKFNDDYNSKAGNKQKPQRPDDLVIQNIKSDITKAALVQRTEEANGAPLYVRINELEQWDKIEGCTGRNNQFTTLKLCDDEGNDFGSDRASTQSVMGDGCLHLNWNANTTVPKLLRYFRYVLTDGPVSRLTLATVPDEELGADIPVFGDYGEEYDAALKPFIDNLKAATGVIDCQQARRLAKRLKKECAEFASLSSDDVFDNLSHRALVMAFRKACLLYVANGMKWEKSIETFCRWSLFYDMYLKMRLFGDLIRNANGDYSVSRRGPRSLLEDLPDEFTIEDAKRVRQQYGMESDGAKKMIRNWINRGYLTQYSEFSFQKTKK